VWIHRRTRREDEESGNKSCVEKKEGKEIRMWTEGKGLMGKEGGQRGVVGDKNAGCSSPLSHSPCCCLSHQIP